MNGLEKPVGPDVMSELAASFWTDVWTMPWARAVIGIVVLCIVIAIGFYIVSRFRDYADNNRQGPYFADSNLQEMLRRGDISEAEYRTIQSKSYGDSVITGDQQSSPACFSTLTMSANETPDTASRNDDKERTVQLPPAIDIMKTDVDGV